MPTARKIATEYDKALLDAAKPLFLMSKYGYNEYDTLSFWGKLLVALGIKKLKSVIPAHKGKTIRFRRYAAFPPSLEPIIKGRVPTPWLVRNMSSISKEDFYNEALTEEDLKDKYNNLK